MVGVPAADPVGAMAVGVQDPACAPVAGHAGRLRLVPGPSARGGDGAARRAVQSFAGPFQLLRGEWELPEFGLSGVSGEACLVQVAAPSRPTDATDLGEVCRPDTVAAFAPTPDCGAPLGSTSVSRLVRQSRMVEISLSGSGEGLGWATGRGYSTTNYPPSSCQDFVEGTIS